MGGAIGSGINPVCRTITEYQMNLPMVWAFVAAGLIGFVLVLVFVAWMVR